MMPNRLYRRSKYVWFSLRHWKRRLIFWGGAIAVGSVAVLFAVVTAYANEVFHRLLDVSQFLPLLVSPLGLGLVVFLTRKYFPGSQGSGIPQTIAALKISDPDARQSVLSLRIATGKMFMTLLALFSGASAGREGPTVQIGASIMHALGRLGFFSRVDAERSLILAGGAAGVAAAFNTPLAGIVFAIEEMSRSFEERTSGAVLTAIILAGMASLAMIGNYTYFGHTNDSVSFTQGWMYVIACGITGGIMGGIFSMTLINANRMLPEKVVTFMREKPVRFAAACGFVLAVIGILSGSATYGTGYTEAKHILEGTENVSQDYGILKMLATIVSYLSGIPGGIFAPSLAIGAGFGSNLASLFSDAPAGALATLGMVAYFSGVVQAPITAFVIVMEMTDNHTMTIPLMTASVIAYAVSRIVCPSPLYKTMAESFLAKARKEE